MLQGAAWEGPTSLHTWIILVIVRQHLVEQMDQPSTYHRYLPGLHLHHRRARPEASVVIFLRRRVPAMLAEHHGRARRSSAYS